MIRSHSARDDISALIGRVWTPKVFVKSLARSVAAISEDAEV